MAAIRKPYKLSFIKYIYWFLLVYILAALVWWYIALMNQTRATTELKLVQLDETKIDYAEQKEQILQEENRKQGQYIGEGVTFLVVILLGAVFVYRAVKKQIELSHQQQNFMMAVTHELKTPIASARLNIETLLKYKLEEEKEKNILRSALQETHRLNMLTNNILLAAQMDQNIFQQEIKEVQIDKVLEAVVEDYRDRFPKRTIDLFIEKPFKISGDELLLQIAFSNLVDNALKYSAPETSIFIDLAERDDHVRLKVYDRGPGIKPAEKKRIFHKFYRVGDESTRKTKGTGLGLYLTKKILKEHRADIFVTDNKPQGSIFVVQFYN